MAEVKKNTRKTGAIKAKKVDIPEKNEEEIIKEAIKETIAETIKDSVSEEVKEVKEPAKPRKEKTAEQRKLRVEVAAANCCIHSRLIYYLKKKYRNEYTAYNTKHNNKSNG